MAYENLKAAIKQAIKQNNNQEITGDILQATLLSIVDNLGNNKAEKSDVTAELAKKFDKANVAQETGSAVDKVMSQKVVSDKIADLIKRNSAINISTYYSNTTTPEVLTMSGAVTKVPESDRKLGFCGIVLTADGWNFIVFAGESLADWVDLTKWRIISVNQLSYLQNKGIPFVGIASPSTNPDTEYSGPMFYLTSELGNYDYFYTAEGENINITDNGLYILMTEDSTSWDIIPLNSIVQETGSAADKIMSQKAITDNLTKLKTAIGDKLSKSQGGEINKPIVITNDNSDYSLTINPDSIYIWSKKNKRNILSIRIGDRNKNIIDLNVLDASSINIGNILNLIANVGEYNSNIYSAYNDTFAASKFKLRSGTNNQVLLGDGSTILLNERNGIPKLNSNGKIEEYQIEDLNGYISTQGKRVYSEYDSENQNVLLKITGDITQEGSSGSIMLEHTKEYGKRETTLLLDGTNGSIEATNATFTDKVKANGFLANNNGNNYTAWTTNGESIDLIDFLSNAAIYVAGKFAIAESGIDNTTVIDSPDSIIFDSTLLGGRFFARKGLICYTHWKADISKNIAPPSRYGIETEVGVFPFNNQLYKFSELDGLYTATCSNSTCKMTKLTI
jgi:hypothetical protein